MADSENILSSALVPKDHLAVFDQIVRERFEAIDLTPMLMYLIDVVPESALPALAEQFDVLGFNGWFLTSNSDDRRALIRNAIAIKKSRGTPWAIREALKSVGYYDVVIEEGTSGFKYDGTYKYDGSINYGAGNWANFNLKLVDLGETKGFSSSDFVSITNMVDRYKNERSKLLEILLSATVSDIETMLDEMGTAGIFNIIDSLNTSFRFDGTYKYDGSQKYGVNTEDFHFSKDFGPDEDTFSLPDDSNLEVNSIDSGFDFILAEGGESVLSEADEFIIGKKPAVII